MKKYVYLFELDSVRKTDNEIISGQRALYNEIVLNGNIVVLTYNQLIDSRAFFSLLDNKTYYESFIKLFEKGYIRISQFGGIRTIAQYLLNTIDTEENQYIYSALPIKRSQRRLVELIKRSITFSDLSEINEYIHRTNRTDDELKDLFVEIVPDNSAKNKEESTSLSVDEMQDVLENLYWLLGMVLKLSTLHDIYIPPREPSEYSCFKLNDYLDYVSKVEVPLDKDPLWKDAINTLTGLKCWREQENNRSLYFRELASLAEGITGENKRHWQYAEAIVNICTDYAYEMSICNISKHYNAEDLKQEVSQDSSFFRDFLSRLEQHWDKGYDAENRFLQGESNSYTEFADLDSIPDFGEAVRIIPEVEKDISCNTVHRYEYKLKLQRRVQKLLFLKRVPRQIVSLLFVAILVMLLNILLEVFHSLCIGEYNSLTSLDSFFNFGLETIIFFTIGEYVTTKISEKCPKFLSLSESVKGITCILKDSEHFMYNKSSTYTSEYGVEKVEKKSMSAPIDFCESTELKKYVAFYKNNPELVVGSSEYPIANITDRLKLKSIVRDQELNRRKYGVVYSSPFNTMVVDPIEDGKENFYSYERVVPTAKKNGVVLFTMRDDKIVLVQQYRHAIQQEQLCCPRGFGENGINNSDNAKKEIYEELGAVIVGNPIELGKITADSGLSSSKATVFLIKIEKYVESFEEGIRGVVELSPAEFETKIRNEEIDDGYTLAAYALYLGYKQKIDVDDV